MNINIFDDVLCSGFFYFCECFEPYKLFCFFKKLLLKK